MMASVHALHSQHIVHADIKPDNFLFTDKSEAAALKMIDFGHSQRVLGWEHLHRNTGTVMSLTKFEKFFPVATVDNL